MRSANDNRKRSRWTITIDDGWDGEEFEDVYLVTIYKGEPKGEPEHAEIIEGSSVTFAYARSMARHLRCPIIDSSRRAS